MNKLREYFIGDILKSTDDVFERARAIMLLRLCYMFTVIFLLPLITDIIVGYEKAFVIHLFAFFTLSLFPFIIKKQNNLDKSINIFFTIGFVISLLAFMCLNSAELDKIGTCWSVYFLVLSALLQRGTARVLFCCFLNWIPMLYVIINMESGGALTWEWIEQKGAVNPPLFLMFIPIMLLIYAVWTHSTTIQYARLTITEQKKIIEEKNKAIVSSIHYAKRIQNSLLPTDWYIDKNLKRLQKK